MHDVCITNITSVWARVIGYSHQRSWQSLNLLDWTEQKLRNNHKLNWNNNQSIAKQTLGFHSSGAWHCIMTHKKGILSYIAAETFELTKKKKAVFFSTVISFIVPTNTPTEVSVQLLEVNLKGKNYCTVKTQRTVIRLRIRIIHRT